MVITTLSSNKFSLFFQIKKFHLLSLSHNNLFKLQLIQIEIDSQAIMKKDPLIYLNQ